MDLIKDNRVSFVWVLGYQGIRNERADRLAEERSEVKMVGPEPSCGVLFSYIKSMVKDFFDMFKSSRWSNAQGLRQSEMFIHPFLKASTATLLALRRDDIQPLVDLLTGDGPVKNLSRIGCVQNGV